MHLDPPSLASELYHILRAVDEAVRDNHRRFGAEVKMTDASNSGAQDASVDATSVTRLTNRPRTEKRWFVDALAKHSGIMLGFPFFTVTELSVGRVF
jgi:hypothetical protein